MTDQLRDRLGRLEGELASMQKQVARMEDRFDGQMKIISSKIDGIAAQLATLHGERLNASQTWTRIFVLPGAVAALVGLAMTWVGKH